MIDQFSGGFEVNKAGVDVELGQVSDPIAEEVVDDALLTLYFQLPGPEDLRVETALFPALPMAHQD